LELLGWATLASTMLATGACVLPSVSDVPAEPVQRDVSAVDDGAGGATESGPRASASNEPSGERSAPSDPCAEIRVQKTMAVATLRPKPSVQHTKMGP
jgi:hypothetical protein